MRFVVAACVLAALSTSACTQLPAAGPSATAIVSGAGDAQSLDYLLVDVDERVLDLLATRSRDSLAGSFGGKGGGGAQTIGVGDEIEVTIWEAANGGLFSTAAGSLGGGSKSTTIPAQPVAADGTVSIPYAGSIRASGRTPTAVKADIEAALAGKAIEPQVLVKVSRSASNVVTVLGDAARGGIVPVSARGIRLLDALAASGGLSAPTDEVQVELVRGRRTARVPLTRIVSEPEENVYLAADDVVAFLRRPQTFTVFGAAGTNREVDFPLTGIMLDEALARVGGLVDLRSDPAGVFVFRYEQPAVARALDDPAAQAAGRRPVVYRLDLRDPKGLFRAKRFEVADGDLVYVANANLNELQKFVALVNGLAQPPLVVRRAAEAF